MSPSTSTPFLRYKDTREVRETIRKGMTDGTLLK